MRKTTVLCILDGLGSTAASETNAVFQASTPLLDNLEEGAVMCHLAAHGEAVGLPAAQMGNSEVGHLNIGAGRVVLQDLPRINKTLSQDFLEGSETFQNFVKALKNKGGACHLMGLLSDGGVHSHMKHMVILARALSKAGVPCHIHAFTDGRDTAPEDVQGHIRWLEEQIQDTPLVQLSTIVGRYYAMDRDQRWERVHKAYDAIVHGNNSAEVTAADDFYTAMKALEEAGTTGEFFTPICAPSYQGFQPGDGILMANFRTDRAREILTALLDPQFQGFETKPLEVSATLGLVSYSTALDPFMEVLFKKQEIDKGLGSTLAAAGKTQLRLAETEKYPHVTFFFNGGQEAQEEGEDRIMVPSPKVETYDLQPEMSAAEVTEKLCRAIRSQKYDFIIVNYANPDMVGHTGSLPAAIKAVETVDRCVREMLEALEEVDGQAIITADHGNCEVMVDPETGAPHTAHTTNLVPCYYIGNEDVHTTCEQGALCDLAPSILHLMGLEQPVEMTGSPLFSRATK